MFLIIYYIIYFRYAHVIIFNLMRFTAQWPSGAAVVQQ